MRIRTSGLVATGMALAASLALAGCGAGSGSGIASANGGGTNAAPVTTTSAGGSADLVKWAQCLRANGIDVKDPDPATGAVNLPGNGDSPQAKAALEKCKQYQATSGSTGLGANADDPAVKQWRLALAKCMRGQGIDWPDPSPSGGMAMPQLTPQLQAAMAVCQKAVPRPGSGK